MLQVQCHIADLIIFKHVLYVQCKWHSGSPISKALNQYMYFVMAITRQNGPMYKRCWLLNPRGFLHSVIGNPHVVSGTICLLNCQGLDAIS